ncbi:MAG: ABC transporter ATP-binding protein [Firmicutes bacterium]|nr:ABC transporter ATP-binding protein [Bacillota bacterium]
MGPSACGKTTLLSLLAGLQTPDAGEICGLSGKSISYVFQEPRLLDWLTAEENIALVLEDLFPPAEVCRRVEEQLEGMGLLAYRRFYPRRLSGGQRQRVAIARALAYPSRLLLMDEPFKSLDLGLKLDLIARFLASWQAAPRTVVCVTHEVKEALLLADKVVVLTRKPAVVKAVYPVPVPREERRADTLALLALEREITAALLREEEREEPSPLPA